MSTILPHPTLDQQQQLARMRAMRSMMRDDDPELAAEAQAVFHILRENEWYWRRQSDKLWRVIYVLVGLVGFLGAWVLI